MSMFKNLAKLFSSPARIDEWAYWVAVKCHRCGEVIRARMDLRNDLSIDYGEEGGSTTYFCRKMLMGENGQCFQRIEIELTFNANHKLLNREISGGVFVNVNE
ncbi:MAG: hypothetical protein AB1894_15515 [Chloroflexota bacterium]